LGDKVEIIDEVIKFLNESTQVELMIMGVKDQTFVIVLASEVHTKISMMMAAHYKCNAVGEFTQAFRNEFRISIELGLPPPWILDRWFYSVKSCNDTLNIEKILSNLKLLLSLLKEI
jgi:hypothetical protein